jgi:hypothetical protein
VTIKTINYSANGNVRELFDASGKDILQDIKPWASDFLRHLQLNPNFDIVALHPPLISLDAADGPFASGRLLNLGLEVTFGANVPLKLAQSSKNCSNSITSSGQYTGTLSLMETNFRTDTSRSVLESLDFTDAKACLLLGAATISASNGKAHLSNVEIARISRNLHTVSKVRYLSGTLAIESDGYSLSEENVTLSDLVLAGQNNVIGIASVSGSLIKLARTGQPSSLSAVFGSSVGLIFVPGGAPYSLLLSTSFPIPGGTVPAGSFVDFTGDGRMRRAYLSADTSIRNFLWKSNTDVSFYSNGSPKQGVLAREAVVNGLHVAPDSPVKFFLDGALAQGTLALPGSIYGRNLNAGQSFSISESEKRVRDALILIASSNARIRSLGWNSIRATVAAKEWEQGDSDAVATDVEMLALQERSAASLEALEKLYEVVPKTRRERLERIPDATDKVRVTAFQVAALSYLRSPQGPLSLDRATDSPNTYKYGRSMLHILGSNVDAIGVEAAKKVLRISAPQVTEDDLFLATGIYSNKQLRKTLHQPDSDIALGDLLLKQTSKTRNQATLLDSYNNQVSQKFVSDDLEGTSLASLMASAKYNPINDAQSVPDRTTRVEVAPTIMDAQYSEFIMCGRDCGSDRLHGRADSASLVPYSQLRIDYGYRDSSVDNWQCFSGSTRGAGACFDAFQQGRSYDGVAIQAFGLHQRSWLVGSHNNAKPTYTIRTSFLPSRTTNWIALRWTSSSGAVGQINGDGGFLYTDPVAEEKTSGWKIYPVNPGERISFHATFTVSPDITKDSPQGPAWIGFHTSRQTDEALEVMEIGQTLAPELKPIPPLKLNQASASDPLLGYVAGIQQLSTPEEASPDLTNTILSGLLSAHYLQRLGSMALSPPIVPSEADPNYIYVDWKQRQKLAISGSPLVAYRAYKAYGGTLEAQTVSQIALLKQLLIVETKLLDALKGINTLTTDELNEAIQAYEQATPGSGAPAELQTACQNISNGAAIQTTTCLQSAVVGAEATVGDTLQTMKEQLSLNCKLIELHAFVGIGSNLIIQPSDEVRTACGGIIR